MLKCIIAGECKQTLRCLCAQSAPVLWLQAADLFFWFEAILGIPVGLVLLLPPEQGTECPAGGGDVSVWALPVQGQLWCWAGL